MRFWTEFFTMWYYFFIFIKILYFYDVYIELKLCVIPIYLHSFVTSL